MLWRGAPNASGAGEALGVAHVRPHVGLDVRVGLTQVVAVVVHPLVEKVFDRQAGDLGMHASSIELPGLQRTDQVQACAAFWLELRQQLARSPSGLPPP